ncbi:PfkB family carbohydrate kinase [Arthrobacter sp. B3I4]|uniref:PfkB family carbohydrate kinase n=1 Tax=Arthrobacter sp. B3I4 TaxID=3042267 RepID=UPI0027893007|nr:PfkB family carbohydrate kinase [Arthrobacter sp. B3I4]MDQ0755240.1 D-beta-D-heptose 7-phosphate kinase/D-beta-D-heptose 1-phosphate adenosyltransferase [Arthrobacter sp. B3I4]
MNIVVVGDVLLDVDLDGEATRLCPDAPVPVVDITTVRARAGGAGLVARMLANDGHDVRLVTALGRDEPGHRLLGELTGITVVAGPSGAPTPVKTRLRAGGHPVARIDEGCRVRSAPEVTPKMLAALSDADVLVVADYGRGLTRNSSLRTAVATLARSVPVIWDPHPAGAAPVPGVTVVTPNQSEAQAAVRAAGAGAPGGAGEVAAALLRHWQSKAVLLTQADQGATLVQVSAPVPVHLAAPSVAVRDSCGAGDRLAASLAGHLVSGSALEESCRRAVREASAFLTEGGVAALPSLPRPLRFPSAEAEPDALAVARRVRALGGTVVATGGCFDLLHAGHARTLAAARGLGDCLIVCLNSDDSTRRLKGAGRPIISQQDRAELLLSLHCVDAVLVFDEATPERALAQLRPDIWVKGGDYDPARLPESALVRSWGGRCLSVPYHPARSTTGLAAALARVG